MSQTTIAPGAANFVGGEWTAARGGRTYERHNPWRPSDVVGEFPSSSAEARSSRVSHSLPKGSVSSTTRAAMKSARTASVLATAALASARISAESASRAPRMRSRSARLASRNAPPEIGSFPANEGMGRY